MRLAEYPKTSAFLGSAGKWRRLARFTIPSAALMMKKIGQAFPEKFDFK
jgi:hypothetical protein